MVDTLTPPKPPRRWFRLKLRTLMVAIPVVALAIVYLAKIGPFRHDPYADSLREYAEWCGSGTDSFMSDSHYDMSGPQPVYVIDHPEAASVPCLVKVAFVHAPRSNGMASGCDASSHALAIDGRSKETHDIYSWAVQGGQSSVSAAEMIEYRKLVSTLPASHWWIPDGNSVLVGFSRGKSWQTRTYDKDRLPPGVSALMGKFRISTSNR